MKKGDLIGTVTDYAGKEIERIVSPADAYIMDGLAGPPVRAGEAVVTIGIPAATPRQRATSSAAPGGRRA